MNNPGQEPSGALGVHPLHGLPEIREGDDLGTAIAAAATGASGAPGSSATSPAGSSLRSGDCVVVTQKIVSKAEGRVATLDASDPDVQRRALIESESARVLRRRGDLMITETRHGFVCANAGVDASNVPDGSATLLPLDADHSAGRIRSALSRRLGVDVAVVVSDTFGRPWRQGVCDVAIGVAGLAAIVDLRGSLDGGGRELEVTEVAIADEVAAAADLVMGKARRVPVAIVRGLDAAWLREGSARELVRPAGEDLFR